MDSIAGKQHAVHRMVSGSFTANEGSEDLYQVARSAQVCPASVHMKTSTVLEELNFASALRTPGNISRDVRNKAISELLCTLGLKSKTNTQVKCLAPIDLKRLAIGVELLSLPNILFVDEPLIGDRKQDWETICMLKTLARLEICQVVLSLHAPRPELFTEISNHILLLSSRGDTLSVGTSKDAVQYLASCKRRNYANLAVGDFLLLSAQYAKETWPCDSDEQINTALLQFSKTRTSAIKPAPKRTPEQPLHVQFQWLFSRELLYVKRNAWWLVFRFVVVGILLGIVAVMFQSAGDQTNAKYTLAAHFGSFVFPVLVMCFASSMPTAYILFTFKQVMLREENGNTYSMWPAILTKLISEHVIHFALASYGVLILHWSVGWQANVIYFIAAFFMIAQSSTSYTYYLVAACAEFDKATNLVIYALAPQLLFLGAMVRYALMPSWISWIHYVCNLAWGMKILVATEFNDAACVTAANCAQWKQIKALDYMDTDDVWQYYVILVAFVVFYRLVSFYKFFKLANRVK